MIYYLKFKYQNNLILNCAKCALAPFELRRTHTLLRLHVLKILKHRTKIYKRFRVINTSSEA